MRTSQMQIDRPFVSWNSNLVSVLNPAPPNYTNYTNYTDIAKNFISKFSNSIMYGISFINSYFDPDATCSLYVHHDQTVNLFEVTGYLNLQKKLSELDIRTFTYLNSVQTAQPIGSDNILISLLGQTNINDKPYNFESVFILKKKNSEYVIINYILQLFIQ